MPFVSCSKFNTSQATQDQAITDLAQELLNKQNALNDCSGNPLAGTVPTCAQMTTAISDAVAGVSTAPTGAAGGDLQGTYPNPTVVPASTTQAGKVEMATTAEALAGTSTSLAVAPAGLKAAIDAIVDSDAQTLSVGASGLTISNGNTVDVISGGIGNLLQWRADGAYYGVEAAPNTSNLYFDPVLGNNSNSGTEASPLATIDEGIRRNNTGTAWTAWLAEGKTHEWRSSWSNGYGQSIIQRPYGDTVDAIMATMENPSVAWYYAAELPTTTVKYISDSVDSSGRESPMVHEQTGVTPNEAIKSYAITHDCSDLAENPVGPNSGFLFGDGLSIIIAGGGVVLGTSFYLTQSIIGTQQVAMYNVELTGAGNKLLNLNLSSSHNMDIRTVGIVGGVIPDTGGSLTYKARTATTEFGQYISNATGRITANVFSTTDIGV